MKVRFWRILALAGCAVLIFAVRSYAGPPLMNFQGKLLNSAGIPLTGSYSVTFSIYKFSSGGPAVWTETQSIVISSSDNGIYSVMLGGVNPININFDGNNYWLGEKVGSDTEMTPRFRLASVPFAFSADKLYSYDTAGVLKGTIKTASWLSPEGLLSGIGYTSPAHMFFNNGGTILAVVGEVSSGYYKGKPFAWFPGILTVDDNLNAHGTLEVTGLITVHDGMVTDGSIYDKGNLQVDGNIVTNGTLHAGGKIDCYDIQLNGDLQVNGQIHLLGNLTVDSNLNVTGVKNFVQQHPTDPTKEIAYTSLEGPEAGTYCRGKGKLENGIAVIQLPETFPLVTSAEAIITTQATPRGDCKGLYVAEASPTQIVIKELQGGKSNVEFDYLVQGVRKGYENNPVIRERTKTKALPGKPPEAK